MNGLGAARLLKSAHLVFTSSISSVLRRPTVAEPVGSKRGAGEHEQVVGEHPQPNPPLPCRRRLGSGTGAVRADFQSADASFAARAPAQRGVRRARARPAQLPRQHDLADATLVGGLLVGLRGEATVGDGQLLGPLEQRDVPDPGRVATSARSRWPGSHPA